jgi:hypothetical protein
MLRYTTPRLRQPLRGVGPIAKPNPLAARLLRLVDFRGGVPFDLISGTYLTQVGTSIAETVTPRGRGLANGNETSYWTLPVLTELPSLGSFLWVGAQNGGTSTIVLRDSTSSSGTIPIWRNSGFDMRLGGTDYTGAGTFNAGPVYSVLVTAGASAGRLYVDGALVINGSTPGATGLTSPWCIHQNGNSGQGGLSTSLLLAIWDRELTQKEALSVSLNPWQLFAPAQRRTFAFQSSGFDAAELVISGLAPTADVTTSGNTSIVPTAGALALAGAAPTALLTSNYVATPSAGAAVLAGLAPSLVKLASFVTEPLINNTGTILASESVVWSWYPGGRIGSLTGITPIEGVGTTEADGTLIVAGLSTGAGLLMVGQRVTTAADDLVFYEAGTIS